MSEMNEKNVQLCGEIDLKRLAALLFDDYGLNLTIVPAGEDIPGSFWGAPEAGLIRDQLFIRLDTPVHSALHEASHWICMTPERRANLHTDAGGTVLEECGVNLLQILLAEALPDVGRAQMLQDMTAWGYSYREGSVYAWLEGDAKDARDFLKKRGLLSAENQRLPEKITHS